MTKIAFYHNHKGDIGHMVHLLRIIEAIRRRAPSCKIFVFQAGRPQPDLEKTAGISWLHLPRPFYSQANYFSSPRVPPAVSALRGRFLACALSRIRPDAFITDFFPFGRRECGLELLPALKSLESLGTEIFACVPMPYFSHSSDEIDELFRFSRFYRKILIHTPPELDLEYMARWIGMERRISRKAFLDVMRKLRRKLYFTGYVQPSTSAEPPPIGLPEGKTILVHRGGGSTSPDIISKALLAKRLLDPSYSMLVVAGPATSKQEMGMFKTLIRRNGIRGVKIRRFVPSLRAYIEKSSVCVGSGGGTSYELLFYGKKCVVIPFTGLPGARRADQLSRAHLLKSLIGAGILNYESLTVENLAQAIRRQIASRRPPVSYGITKRRWFEGSARSAEMILSHVGSK